MKRLAAFLALVALASSARAGSYSVQVGYADNLRASGFFPNPWFGAAGVTFAGEAPTGNPGQYDSGAILVTNTGATPITVTDALVNNFANGESFQIWGG